VAIFRIENDIELAEVETAINKIKVQVADGKSYKDFARISTTEDTNEFKTIIMMSFT